MVTPSGVRGLGSFAQPEHEHEQASGSGELRGAAE